MCTFADDDRSLPFGASPFCHLHKVFCHTMKYTILPLLLFLSMARTWANDFKAFRGTVPEAYDFWFYDPETEPDPRAHFPLLIFLHGKSLCGNDLQKVKKYGAIDAVAKGRIIDTYILAPQNPGGPWDPERVWRIVEWAEEHYSIDKSRIYVYGMSLGGFGTLDLAATYPEKIACAMGLCGGATKRDLSGLATMPLWIMHGTADELVNVKESDRVVEAIKATGDDSRLIYTRCPGVNHGRFARCFYVRQTYDWLFSHSLDDPGREVNRSVVIDLDVLDSAYSDMGVNEAIPFEGDE